MTNPPCEVDVSAQFIGKVFIRLLTHIATQRVSWRGLDDLAA